MCALAGRVCHSIAAWRVGKRLSRKARASSWDRNKTQAEIGLPWAGNGDDVPRTAKCLRLGISIICTRNETSVGKRGPGRLGPEGNPLFPIGVPHRQDDNVRRDVWLCACVRQEKCEANY